MSAASCRAATARAGSPLVLIPTGGPVAVQLLRVAWDGAAPKSSWQQAGGPGSAGYERETP